eukprot:TRINITY_DN11281_c0_g1_i2.p1 TRINITY_DN11281_c0_g1~~TRINITY_DN11281_c0_g1_i2.p1  ORF type:complete len:460 (+),score=60.84 TRINITY_DN11281_c0_g1_i2:61-1440(+)
MSENEVKRVQHITHERGDVEAGDSSPLRVGLSKHQKALRWKNHMAALCLFMPVTFTFAASPLVDMMNAEFSETPVWLPAGITTISIMSFCSMVVIMPLMGSLIKLVNYQGISIWLVFLMSTFLPLSIGVAASTKQSWVLYVGAVIASPGHAISVESGKVMVAQWWALDSKQRLGLAFFGLMVGLSVLLLSCVFGPTLQYWGLAWAAYAQALLFVIVSLWPLYLALRGELGPPPGDLMAKGSTATPQRPSNLFRSLSFYQICFYCVSTPWVGMGMKMLMTSIFQAAYKESFLRSANLTSASLVLYAVARGVFTYLAKPGHVMPLQSAMLLISGMLYGSYPLIIQHLPVFYLALANVVTGGIFAGSAGMQMVVMLEVYTPQELPMVFPKTEALAGIGLAFGPLTSYYLKLVNQSAGIMDQQAYDLAFYSFGGIYLLAAANIAVLQVRLSARKRLIAQDTTC